MQALKMKPLQTTSNDRFTYLERPTKPTATGTFPLKRLNNEFNLKTNKKRLTIQKLANVTNDTATDTNRKTPSAATVIHWDCKSCQHLQLNNIN